jgi:SMI1 / KNR4 family (SUKH-1)
VTLRRAAQNSIDATDGDQYAHTTSNGGGIVWDAKEIHSRLAAMRAADPSLERFGASRHRHRLGRRLGKRSVTSFESAHGVPLPDAYRSFLLEVGNGGAGPNYGLFPLDGHGMRDLERNERFRPGYLAIGFPHTEVWNRDYYPRDQDRPSSELLSEDEYFDARWTIGSLVIAEFGSGAFHRLVVAGPARGQVWLDDRAADGGLTPETDFYTWYNNWLNSQPIF